MSSTPADEHKLIIENKFHVIIGAIFLERDRANAFHQAQRFHRWHKETSAYADRLSIMLKTFDIPEKDKEFYVDSYSRYQEAEARFRATPPGGMCLI